MSGVRVHGVNVHGESFSADTTLCTVECCACGILYAIPDSLDDWLRKYNRAAYPNGYGSTCCPAGHKWHYPGRNTEQIAKRDAERARDAAARARAERDQAEASARAQKAAATRARNERDRERRRTAAGVCPCCNRSFKQLARHVCSQHPDYPETKA